MVAVAAATTMCSEPEKKQVHVRVVSTGPQICLNPQYLD